MADRIHFWHYVIDTNGEPLENAEVRLYLSDDPNTEANIYISEDSISYTTCSEADIKTNNNGFVEFWLAGNWESGGYDFTQTFRFEWFKAGKYPGVIENYNPWPNITTWQRTNTGAGKDHLNKFVSDYYINKWLTHISYTLPSGGNPHDLDVVDYENGCLDDDYSKVVSNKFLNDILTNSLSTSACSISGSIINSHTETIASSGWTPSGSLYYKEITHSNVDNDSTVLLMEESTSKCITPMEVVFTGTNTTRIWVNEDNNMVVTIFGSA